MSCYFVILGQVFFWNGGHRLFAFGFQTATEILWGFMQGRGLESLQGVANSKEALFVIISINL